MIIDCRYAYEYLGGHISDEQRPWLSVCVRVLNGVLGKALTSQNGTGASYPT